MYLMVVVGVFTSSPFVHPFLRIKVADLDISSLHRLRDIFGVDVDCSAPLTCTSKA